jgi:dTDP-4-amino-4,6-dideoxygalactose transaminase
MSNLSAAVGLAQFAELSERIDRRHQIRAEYRRLLEPLGFRFFEAPAGVSPTWWLTVAQVPPGTRDRIVQALEAGNIESRPVWKPLHLQKLYSDSPFYGNHACEKLFADGLCLPSGHRLAIADIERIATIIRQTL